MPFHSILIAAYNRFNYLNQTIQSCLSSADEDFEILVADDGSDSVSADAFYEYISKLDQRIRIIRHSSNRGVGTRFSELHRRARGKLLHLIGSDDLIHPYRLGVSKSAMQSIDSYNGIFCSTVKQLSAQYTMMSSTSTYISCCAHKAGMFFQPLVLHPTISTWHPDLSGFIPYKEGMRAAVDYCYYVDNYFRSQFLSVNKSLTYLVHSSSGISRDYSSRCNQLAMHDYVMHRLWSYFTSCSLADISAIRQIVVTGECPLVDARKYGKNGVEGLIDILLSVKYAVIKSCQKKSIAIGFSSFIYTDENRDDFLQAIEYTFTGAERCLRSYSEKLI